MSTVLNCLQHCARLALPRSSSLHPTPSTGLCTHFRNTKCASNDEGFHLLVPSSRSCSSLGFNSNPSFLQWTFCSSSPGIPAEPVCLHILFVYLPSPAMDKVPTTNRLSPSQRKLSQGTVGYINMTHAEELCNAVPRSHLLQSWRHPERFLPVEAFHCLV